MRHSLKYFLIGAWVIFTVSLVGWWFSFGLRQLERLRSLGGEPIQELIDHQQMLIWEGLALAVSVVGGGLALFFYAWRERRLSRQLQLFLMGFAHELKTPLTTLRLELEGMADGQSNPARLERLQREATRLSLSLENSLSYVRLRDWSFYPQNVSLAELVRRLQPEWQQLRLSIRNPCVLRGDERALEMILRNLIANADIHGGATAVEFRCDRAGTSAMRIVIEDDGRGFDGDIAALGMRPLPPLPGSNGTGIGLYLVRELVRKSGGKFEVLKAERGFTAVLELPEGSAA